MPHADDVRISEEMCTDPICLHALPAMLQLLGEGIRCQDIDDTKIIDRVEALVGLVRGSQAAFVLVENEMLPVAGILLWESHSMLSQALRIGRAHRPPHGHGFRRRRAGAGRLRAARFRQVGLIT